jgi:hypothetical protein
VTVFGDMEVFDEVLEKITIPEIDPCGPVGPCGPVAPAAPAGPWMPCGP